MKHMPLVVLAIANACGPRNPPAGSEGSASGEVALLPPVTAPSGSALGVAYADSKRDVRLRVETLRQYVRSIDSRLPTAALSTGTRPLRATSRVLPLGVVADVTDEQWARIDAFYDGRVLKRLRLLPPPGAEPRTEEFYYDDGKLVYVFMEPNGALKRDPHVQIDGDAFYFGKEGLIAWVKPGGAGADPGSVGFKAWNTKLLAEGKRFPHEAR